VADFIENSEIYIPLPVFDADVGGPRQNFAKMFRCTGKTRIVRLPYAKENVMNVKPLRYNTGT